MNRIIDFIRTMILGGLLVIVPITILIVVLAQLYDGLYELSESFVDSLPLDLQNEALFVALTTVVWIVVVCFVTGLVMQTQLGTALKAWFNRNIGRRIPMYNALANLTRRFIGAGGQAFAPVEVDLYGSDARAIGFLIEELPDDRCTVFIPSAPVPTVGNIVVVPGDSVTPMDATTAEAITIITQWGIDSHTLYLSGKSESAVKR